MNAPAWMPHPDVIVALRRLALAMNYRLDDETMWAFASALDDLPPGDVVAACDLCARTERFWPRPRVLREYVDRVRRAATPTTVRPRRETYTDPATGERVELWTCRDCQDRGVVPCTEAGGWLSWDAVRGIGDYLGDPVRHHHVTRCTTCNRLAEPKARATGETSDDTHRRRPRS